MLPPTVSVLCFILLCPILLFISSSPEPKIVDSSFDERKKGEGISVTIFSEILLLLQKFKSLGQFLRIDLVFCKILNLLCQKKYFWANFSSCRSEGLYSVQGDNMRPSQFEPFTRYDK